MTKRIVAADARLTTRISAQKAAEVQAQTEAARKIVSKIWNEQRKNIICSAVDGHLLVVLSNSLAMGWQLDSAGFSITEKGANFSDNEVPTVKRGEELLASALELSTKSFLLKSKVLYKNEAIYEKYIRGAFERFLDRARIIKDTKNDFSLLNFLNSENYSSLGYDGGFNEFSASLVYTNRIMHMIVTGEVEFSADQEKWREKIISLMPSTKVHRSRIMNDLLGAKNHRGYFIVAWKSPCRSKENSESVLTADRMAWLASKRGQDLMNFVFGRIEDAAVSGGKSVDFYYRTSGIKWFLEDYCEIEEITLYQLKEILDAKGYKVKKIRGERAGLFVGW